MPAFTYDAVQMNPRSPLLRSDEVAPLRQLVFVLRSVRVAQLGKFVLTVFGFSEIAYAQQYVEDRLRAQARNSRTSNVLECHVIGCEDRKQLGGDLLKL